MTDGQYLAVRRFIHTIVPEQVHHGDCIGADVQFDEICRALPLIRIHIHPPIDSKSRAWKTEIVPSTVHQLLPFLDRNHAIVDACDFLIAVPSDSHERKRSGTWATIRYARKQGKRIYLVMPDGTVILDEAVKNVKKRTF